MEDAMTKFSIFVAALALSGGARAETPINVDAPRSAVVRIGDLDLASAYDRSVLNRRIASAIEEICGSYAGVTEPSETDRIDACRVVARQSADRQLAARLTTLQLAAADDRH
jgi:UrcA family protein